MSDVPLSKHAAKKAADLFSFDNSDNIYKQNLEMLKQICKNPHADFLDVIQEYSKIKLNKDVEIIFLTSLCNTINSFVNNDYSKRDMLLSVIKNGTRSSEVATLLQNLNQQIIAKLPGNLKSKVLLTANPNSPQNIWRQVGGGWAEIGLACLSILPGLICVGAFIADVGIAIFADGSNFELSGGICRIAGNWMMMQNLTSGQQAIVLANQRPPFGGSKIFLLLKKYTSHSSIKIV